MVLVRALPLLILAALLLAPLAEAHVTKTAGAYTFKVGWLREPPATQERNAVTMQVWRADTKQPVTGLGTSLTVTISIPGQSKTLDMKEVEDAPGNYSVPIVLSRAGSYNVHVEGAIAGTQVSQDFKIEDVRDISEDAFPSKGAAGPTSTELQSEYEKLRSDFDKLQQEQSRRIPGAGLVALLGAVAVALALSRRQP